VIQSGVLAVALGAGAISPALADQTTTYQVQPGDTLFNIARTHQTTVADLTALNSVTDPSLIVAGRVLTVPAPSATTLAAPAKILPGATCADFTIDDDGIVRHTRSACASAVPVVALAPAPAIQPALPLPSQPSASLMSATYRSQFDGSAYAETNCGPTSLSMGLSALGINLDELAVRRLANVALGTTDPNSGTTWASLAYAARQAGATVVGPTPGSTSWTIDDVKSQVQQGHPVLLLVRYRLLPGNTSTTFLWDHYIVALGVDANGNIVYNDPAFHNGNGAHRTISPTDLTNAWSHTSEGLVRTAMAISK
jgi:LysM repeat protein